MAKYKTVHLPELLLNQVDEVLEPNGYSGRPEFIKEAIREKLAKLKECYENEEVS